MGMRWTCEESLHQSGELYAAEEQRDQEEHVEAHRPVNNVAVRQLHLHVLPGLPHVGAGHPEHPAHQRDGDGLHQRPRGHQHQHAQDEPQHGHAHQPGADGGHSEGELLRRRVGQQAQEVVDVGGQGHAGARAQDLSGVAPRGAPGVQVEGEEAQAQVEGDDDERGVAAGQVEAVDQVQRRQEKEQDQDAVQDPHDDVLEETGTEGQSPVLDCIYQTVKLNLQSSDLWPLPSTGFISCSIQWEHTASRNPHQLISFSQV